MTSSTICSHHRIRTVLLMCVVLLSVSLHAQAQNKETRINLNIRNATLESFVKQLENATGFSFIYGEEVKLTHRITLEMKQKNISEILQRAFENEPITFEISGKHILLHKRPVPQKPVSRKFTISGYVTDGASSETLIGANILESRRSTGTATNPFGFYSLTLPEGERVYITQILGGSYTVATDHGLARISRENADALGAGAEEPSPEAAALDENATLEERVWDTLKCVYDPEIPVDIVNLGLIYDVAVIELENGLHHVAVKMTLTAPGCGMGPHLVMEAKDRIEALEGVEAADVEMVWDPPWNQDMVSEEGRMKLGLI